jgi:hypothetical protein
MENTTTPPAHTPTPWLPDIVMSEQIWSDRGAVHSAQITTREDQDGQCTRVATATGRTVAECRANAAFIVRACNNHRDLLRELKVAVKFFAAIPEDERRAAEDVLHQALMIENMQAVIASAEAR